MAQTVTPLAHPPETLEGWYALHQIYTWRFPLVDQLDTPAATPEDVTSAIASVARSLEQPADGWSRAVALVGSSADLMVIHFRPDLDSLGAAQRAFAPIAARNDFELDYSFLSVTEAGLYHLTARLAQEAAARGGAVGDEAYARELAERAAQERESDHVRRRLYPAVPAGMPWVSFYPMSKRRDPGQNWYTLTLEERSRLMHSHGMTGRRYAGRVQQIITGAIGFDAWEWGVTLFARDPLDFKKLVTEMRFDEASSKYAEFGEFFVGRVVEG